MVRGVTALNQAAQVAYDDIKIGVGCFLAALDDWAIAGAGKRKEKQRCGYDRRQYNNSTSSAF